MAEENKEPTFEDLIAAVNNLNQRLADLEASHDRHVHLPSGEVVYRRG